VSSSECGSQLTRTDGTWGRARLTVRHANGQRHLARPLNWSAW